MKQRLRAAKLILNHKRNKRQMIQLLRRQKTRKWLIIMMKPRMRKLKVMEKLRINAVFFPLMSTMLPRWLGQIADKLGKSSNVKKVVVLVSGVGSPRNWTHSVSGNSTQVCSDLMEMFINELFPDVTVIK